MDIFEPHVRRRGFLPDMSARDPEAEGDPEEVSVRVQIYRPRRHLRAVASSVSARSRKVTRPLAKSASAIGHRRASR
jgi:hypothetical protein